MFFCFNIFKLGTKTLSTDTLEYKNFNLENISGDFLVESVYDGDTIVIIVPIKLEIFNMKTSNSLDLESSNSNNTNKIILNKIKVRLFGIDTPELKPCKNLLGRNEHILMAKKAKDFLSNLILNKIIKVQFLHNDKYGRPLVKLFIVDNEKTIYINDLLISNGYAKKYDGGCKNNNLTDLVEIIL